jgi:integrase
MSKSLESAVAGYLKARSLSPATGVEYQSTLSKWKEWNKEVPIESMGRSEVREFLDWVYDRATESKGGNPGRTANKCREHLRAVLSWAWEQELIDTLPKFPQTKKQRDVAGRHYLTKAELNALYFATYMMTLPRGCHLQLDIGRYWRAALVLFFNYGLDTGTIWKWKPIHQPILWRNVSWSPACPDGRGKKSSRWGWITYRRVKTSKVFIRPMNRVVHSHLRNLHQEGCQPDTPVFEGGSSRPNAVFSDLCRLAKIAPKHDIETGEEHAWLLKDLRKTCATYYDQHLPESAIEILGHSVRGVTYRHYAHRDPLAFRAITTIPQPTAFLSLIKGHDGECPCCRRQF